MEAVRAVPLEMPDGTAWHTVVGPGGVLVEDVDAYLRYLRAIGSSRNTARAYAGHLALFFRWLHVRDAEWEHLSFDGLCTFAADLSDGSLRSNQGGGEPRPITPRSRATCEAVMAAVYSFLDYWKLEGKGPSDIRLYREGTNRRATTHSFLAHIEQRRSQQERRVKFRGPKPLPPQIINFEDDFERLLTHARTYRDKALLSALYDGGLRISQAIGLHHPDIDVARKSVRITRREDNANGALSKRRTQFHVSVPDRFITYYGLSLTDEQLMLDIDSDYVFVNLSHSNRGAPMQYLNALRVVQAIGRRAGIPDLTPHKLRHTHGTALAKAGWSAPQIAARLGHDSNSSADVYIHLAHDDLAELYAKTDLSRRDA